MKVLVTGATGVIGPSLVDRLLERGWEVVVLARRPPASGLFSPAVTVKKGDITDPPSVAAALTGVDMVFHLAAKLHINDPSGLDHEYRKVNLQGTVDLVEAAKEAGVLRLIYFSTISVYGPGKGGAPFDESSPTAPATIYAKTKLAAEKAVLAARNGQGGPMGVVLRPGAVYGPRMKGSYRRLANWIRRGIFVPVGSLKNRRSLVHERDLVEAALLCSEHPKAPGRVFNVTDGKIHTMGEIVETLHDLLGRRMPFFSLPEAPLMIFFSLVEGLLKRIWGGKNRLPLPSRAVSKLCEDMAVSSEKIRDELGFEPGVDLVSGWREMSCSRRSKRFTQWR